MEPESGRNYVIRLCSGEIREWRFDGWDSCGFAWWCDVETGKGFSEAGLLYAWEILPAGEDGG